MIYHRLQSGKSERRRSTYMLLMINDLLPHSVGALPFHVYICRSYSLGRLLRETEAIINVVTV